MSDAIRKLAIEDEGFRKALASELTAAPESIPHVQDVDVRFDMSRAPRSVPLVEPIHVVSQRGLGMGTLTPKYKGGKNRMEHQMWFYDLIWESNHQRRKVGTWTIVLPEAPIPEGRYDSPYSSLWHEVQIGSSKAKGANAKQVFDKALKGGRKKLAAKELTEAEVNFLQDVKDNRGRAVARKGRMARRMEKDKYVEKVDYGLNVEGWKLTRKGQDALKKTYSWEKKGARGFTIQVYLYVERCSGYSSPLDGDQGCGPLAKKSKKFTSKYDLFVWLKDWMPKIEAWLRKTGKITHEWSKQRIPGKTSWSIESKRSNTRPGRALGETFQYEEWESTTAELDIRINGRPLDTNTSSTVDRALTGKTPFNKIIEQVKYEDWERTSPAEAKARRFATDKTALDNEWDNAAFHLSDGLRGAWGRLEMLNKIVGGSSWQWGGSELFSRMDGWPKDWAKFKETVEKAKKDFDRGYQGMQKADVILAERRRLRAERQKYLFDVLKEMTRNMPPGVSGAQPFKADVWNPKFKWKGPKGQKELWLDFDHSMSPASKNLDTRFIEVEANGLKSFEVKNTNPKDAAARIWEQLAAQGVA